ncbi:MAG: PH domain-containing protein [bacterium]|nr:PH domain-containing protein [bacterium]
MDQPQNIAQNMPSVEPVNPSSQIPTGQLADQIDQTVYPIQRGWIWENFIVIFLLMLLWVVAYASDIFGIILAIIVWPSSLIGLILRRKYFTYKLEPQYFVLKQGIISKQERHILYGVIQNTFVKQGLLDRIFNLSCLVIENAQGGGKLGAQQVKQQQRSGGIGFSGNKVIIPGLKKEHAELLKTAILQKMKENPMVDTQSGI